VSGSSTFESAKYYRKKGNDMFISLRRDGKAGNGKATKISREKAKFLCFRAPQGKLSTCQYYYC